MSGAHEGLDFSTVIASTVHDMKNSLALLIQAHGQWQARLPAGHDEGPERRLIDYEFAHLNGMLVQLLGLYKLGVNQMPLRPDYHELDDFLEAQLASHQEVLASRGLIARHEVEDVLALGFFDRELIGSVVANLITNAIRYAGHNLLLQARQEGEWLLVSLNDDGPGYPPLMIERQGDYMQGIDPASGSTGLGLYFAARIGALHTRNGVCGRVELANGGPLGGALFTLYLP